MSNLPQQIARNQYIADGITTVYAYTFLVPSANSLVNDIAVYVTTPGNLPDPATDIQPLNTAYTVQGAGVTTGGTITFLPGYVPPISSIITVVRNMYIGIDTDFAVAQNFNGENLDLALERLVLMIQEYFTGLMYTTLTYPINAILPSANLNLLPQLPNNYVWVGLGGKVVATELITQIPLNSLSSPFLLNGVAVTTTGTQLNYLNFAEGTTGTGLLVYSNGATLQNPVIVDPTITGLTLTGSTIDSAIINQPTINQPIIFGVTDGSNAPAGAVGEYITATVLAGAAVPFVTSTTPINVCSINITAGDWDVGGNVTTVFSATADAASCWASTTSATQPDISKIATITDEAGLIASGGDIGNTIPTQRFNVTTTTTIYLSANAFYPSGTAASSGTIWARRRR